MASDLSTNWPHPNDLSALKLPDNLWVVEGNHKSWCRSMPPLPPKKLRRLRVVPDRAGRLTLFHPATHSDPDWWSAVLSDPRLRSKGTDGWEDNLGRHRGEQLTVHCSKCGFAAVKDIDALVFEYGERCSCAAVAARIQDEHHQCRHGRECRLTYQTTNDYQRPRQ